jgi:hypothetical protein
MNDSLFLSWPVMNYEIKNTSAFGTENHIRLVFLLHVLVQCLLTTFSKFRFYKANYGLIN